MTRMKVTGAVTLLVAAVAVVLLVGHGGQSASGDESRAPSTRQRVARPRLEPATALGRLADPPPPGPIGPEGVPIQAAPALAPAAAPSAGTTVDGISSGSTEQFVEHLHAHLAVFVRGRERAIPAGIGIAAGPRFYWLHTHVADGVVHIESPVARRFTLGDLFDVWGEPLRSDRVGPASGPVTAFLDGRHYRGNPRDIPLRAHARIQLDVGRPLVAPAPVAFPAGL